MYYDWLLSICSTVNSIRHSNQMSTMCLIKLIEILDQCIMLYNNEFYAGSQKNTPKMIVFDYFWL